MTERTSWVGERLGIRLVDATTDGVAGTIGLADLAGLAVRRNPRRAHLVVSTVLGKHLPVDPRLSYAAARLLGELAAAALGGPPRPPSRPRRLPGWGHARPTPTDIAGFAAALRGDADQTAKCRGPADPGVSTPTAPLVLGYAETATGLGHAVADSFAEARYLHSTRRRVPGFVAAGTFDEAHSHATEHLLLPADPGWLADATAPVVLVDDELTTGRTAAATIRALHRLAARRHYVVASLLDLRTPAERAVLADLGAELGTRIDVVSLATGTVELPADVLTTAAALVAALEAEADPDRPAPTGPAPLTRIRAPWPAGVPDGGRHGFAPAHRHGLDSAVDTLAAEVAAGLPDGPVLVLGTEELMYAPMRLAVALTGYHDDVRFSTTTRSPVLPVDADGYAIRTRLTFPATEPDPTGAPRFAYNVRGAGFAGVVLVVDSAADSPPLWAPGGLVDAVRAACGRLTVVIMPTPDAA